MQIDNVHSREIPAAAADVGAVLAGLGSDDDRLWPSDRWPTLQFRLQGPLEAESPARHGPVRYMVDAYEPGRRLTFRFMPRLGLVGTHGFEIEPLDGRRTRLTHTLRARVEPRLVPLWPIVRGYHDALIEDVLAQADRSATGREVSRGRWPLWLRVATRAELWLTNRRRRRRSAGPGGRGALVDGAARVGGVAVPPALAGLAALHAAWALGSPWPASSRRELAERVLSDGARMPPAWATWAVALGLGGAAGVVRRAAAGSPSRRVRRLTRAIAGVFLLRGAAGPPLGLIRGRHGVYERLDLAIYSPLALALGAGAAAVSEVSQGTRGESAA